MDRKWKCQAAGCGNEGVQTTPGILRKWCSHKCRKTQYTIRQACVTCGAETSHGQRDGYVERPLCHPCASAERVRWTPEAIVAAIRDWRASYGEPPATADWNPSRSRAMHDEARALRFEVADGRYPTHSRVFDVFGSWNAAMVAAGVTPRVAHGGAGNETRKRAYAA